MATKPLASSLGSHNPGTAGAKRLMPTHKGAPGKASSPNGAKLQALANIAKKRRAGSHKRLPEATAHLGKNLPAKDADGDID